MTLNLHSYGGLWITPFNWDNNTANPHLKDYRSDNKVYEEMHANADLPDDIKWGNA